MAKLHVPSLQHLARNWSDDSRVIAKILVKLAENPPIFSYAPLNAAVRDLLVLGVPYEQIVAGLNRIKRENVRNNLLSVLPLLFAHFAGVAPKFCQVVAKRYYPVGRGLMIPFEPPIMYGNGDQIFFPWFSFWRQNPLSGDRLSLFVTLVDELLMQDPDLENARFQILDFSAASSKSPRTLKVIDAADIPRISNENKTAMLETFVEGFLMAKAKLENTSQDSNQSTDRPDIDPNQPDLFG